jgi:aldehyde:ferredoxin oxidoreductase
MRHAFNVREGINPLTRNIPGRIIGEPPLKEGNVKDITVDHRTLHKEFLELVGWDTETTVPGKESLENLGMGSLVEDMIRVNVPTT